jgi:hypothetical protein
MASYLDNLANMLRKGSDTLVNLPTEIQRFATNPQAFTELVTGKNQLPKETGFVAGATGLPPKNPIQGGVLNPASAPYQQGYEQGEPVAIASMAVPAYAMALRAGAPKAYNALENYMGKTGGIQYATDPKEYRGSHVAPNAKEYGGTLDNLGAIMPEDVYSSKGQRLYGIGDPNIDAEWFSAAYRAKGNPDRMVEIYRAVPKGIKDLNQGDWVTTSRTYAKNHGENTLNGEYELISKKVKAKTLSSEGYPYEFGYAED